MALDPAVVATVESVAVGAPPPAELGPLFRRLMQLHLLTESPPPDLIALIPARSRRVLLLPDIPALWCPVPAVRTPGGHAFEAHPIDAVETRLWRACNGSRTVAAAAESAAADAHQALAFFARLTHPDVQALQLRSGPVRSRDAALLHLVAPARPRAARSAHMHGPDGETTLDRFHVEDIAHAATHFDDVETTVSHAFGPAHPALRGQSYGGALHRALEDRGMLPEDKRPILEIGPGDGELGAAWRTQAAERGVPLGEYIRLDRSPALLEEQRRRQPGTRDMEGSATDIPLPDGSVGLVLCNEVIADLSAVPFDAADPLGEGAPREVALRLVRYGIHPEPRRAMYNLGAWQMLEELHRVMAPGATAFITEFGGVDDAPRETEQLDHPEVSIQFGHLLAVAQGLGFSATVEPLSTFLSFDLHAMWLAQHSYAALRARMRSEGHHLQARAWTPETLELPFSAEGLEWVPITDEGPGPLITRFQALILRLQ
jgi:hypothetical protein